MATYAAKPMHSCRLSVSLAVVLTMLFHLLLPFVISLCKIPKLAVSSSPVICKTFFMALDPFLDGITHILIENGSLIVQCHCRSIIISPHISYDKWKIDIGYLEKDTSSRGDLYAQNVRKLLLLKQQEDQNDSINGNIITSGTSIGARETTSTIQTLTVSTTQNMTTIHEPITLGTIKDIKDECKIKETTVVMTEGREQFRIPLTKECAIPTLARSSIVCHYEKNIESISGEDASSEDHLRVSRENICGQVEDNCNGQRPSCLETGNSCRIITRDIQTTWITRDTLHPHFSDCIYFNQTYTRHKYPDPIEYAVTGRHNQFSFPHFTLEEQGSDPQPLHLYETYIINHKTYWIKESKDSKKTQLCSKNTVKIQMEYQAQKWKSLPLPGSCEHGWKISSENFLNWRHRILITVYGAENQIARLGFTIVSQQIIISKKSDGTCGPEPKCTAPHWKVAKPAKETQAEFICQAQDLPSKSFCFPSVKHLKFRDGKCRKKEEPEKEPEKDDDDAIAGKILIGIWIGLLSAASCMAVYRFYPHILQIWRPIEKVYTPSKKLMFLQWGPFEELPRNYQRAQPVGITGGTTADQMTAERQMKHFTRITHLPDPSAFVADVQLVRDPKLYPQPTWYSVFIPRFHLPRSILSESQHMQVLKIEAFLNYCQSMGINVPRKSDENLKIPDPTSLPTMTGTMTHDLSALSLLGLDSLSQLGDLSSIAGGGLSSVINSSKEDTTKDEFYG